MRKKAVGLLLLLALLCFSIFVFTACARAVNEGIVVDKMYGSPVRTTLGPFDILYTPRDNYCLLIEDETGNRQWYIVDEVTYRQLSIGSVFVFNSKLHQPL